MKPMVWREINDDIDIYIYKGLPRWLSSKESSSQCRRPRFDPCVRNIHEALVLVAQLCPTL